MIRFPTRRLSIALLAQVVFCLVAAPVIAAQQWAMPPEANKDGSKPPRDTGVTIQAAFDASNVRPEEVSDAEQKKGRSRGGINRTGSGYTGTSGQKAIAGSALADALLSEVAQENRVRQGGSLVARVFNPCFPIGKTRVGNPCHELAAPSTMRTLQNDCLRTPLRDRVPAIQPTGPPAN